MSIDHNPQQSPRDLTQKAGEFRMTFNNFLFDHMLFKDGSTPVLDLTKTMLLKSPQPASMFDFIQMTKPLILEDISKLSQ